MTERFMSIASTKPHVLEPESAYDIHDDLLDDPLKMYLQEMGDHTLLTLQQEQDLGRIFRQGRAAEQVFQTGEDTEQIRNEMEAGRAAQEELVHHNLKLVISIAGRYKNQGLSLLDLIQEGNVGLLRGIEGYNPELGFRFSTYATQWIRQGIIRAIANQGTIIHVPEELQLEIIRTKKASRQFEISEGREPTKAELAKILETSEAHITDLNTIATKQKIRSLNQTIEDNEREFGEMIPDRDQPSIEIQAEAGDKRTIIWKMLASLSEREREIVVLHSGLETDEPQTLEAISKKMGVTRERIRQIEAGAHKKLKANPHFRQMVQEYLEQ